MSTINKLGIWMDHSNANLIEFKNEALHKNTISTTFDHEDMEEALSKGEHLMHNKKQQHLAAYYKNLGDEIIQYEEVVLFGPTDAKTELFNILKSDLRFEKIKIDVQPADKMTENQKLAFVKTHFSKD